MSDPLLISIIAMVRELIQVKLFVFVKKSAVYEHFFAVLRKFLLPYTTVSWWISVSTFIYDYDLCFCFFLFKSIKEPRFYRCCKESQFLLIA